MNPLIAEKLKEADKYISGCFDEDNFPSSHGKTQLKSFLLSALTSVREEAIREIVEAIDEEEKPYKEDFKCGGCEKCEACRLQNDDEIRGFNACLKQIKETLTKKLT